MEPSAGVSLLYVEDNRELREALSALLAGEGLEILRARHVPLVISDYSLPDHTGTGMFRQAAESGLAEHPGAACLLRQRDRPSVPPRPIAYCPARKVALPREIG